MKNKALAALGIVAYILSVLSSATNSEGDSTAPVILIVISAISTVLFIILATIRLWKEMRGLAITLAVSAVILFVLSAIQGAVSPPSGSLVIILLNVVKIINFVVSVLAIGRLFSLGDKQIKNNALEWNRLIGIAIKMGIADKYIEEQTIKKDSFELALLLCAIDWAVPTLDYNFDNSLSQIENDDYRKKLSENDDQIFLKGLEINNTDPILDKLITFYVVSEVYLVNTFFPKDGETRYPGVSRMNRLLIQQLDDLPNAKSDSFKEDYKNLFIEFNEKYGKYGKVLKQETIDSMFSTL
jgi:hypothetical protein